MLSLHVKTQHIFSPQPAIMREIDYLQPDPPIAGQKFFVVTHAKMPNGTWLMKIGGVFDSMERADRFAKQAIRRDDSYNIAAGPVGEWLEAIPAPENSDRTEYSKEELNELFKGYHQAQAEARDHFEERKANVMRDGLAAHLQPDEIIPKGPGPDAPISERKFRELAQSEAVHPAERKALGLPELEDSSIELPLTRSAAWKAT